MDVPDLLENRISNTKRRRYKNGGSARLRVFFYARPPGGVCFINLTGYSFKNLEIGDDHDGSAKLRGATSCSAKALKRIYYRINGGEKLGVVVV
jgi:hypothetical protein